MTVFMRLSIVVALSILSVRGLAGQVIAAPPSPYRVDTTRWAPHSMDRPRPPVVTPSSLASIAPPGDSRVLMDGRSLTPWATTDSALRPPEWLMADGGVEVTPGKGAIRTRQTFGDLQMHVEWSPPTWRVGDGQERGNSGILLMGLYEIQILDGWQNDTYADGMAGAIYGQFPPKLSPTRRPVEWNSFDIIFHRPRFDTDGKLLAPARVTLIFNGVLVHDEQVLLGPTGEGEQRPYQAHPDRLPIVLENHGGKVRFRNIWVRHLE